MKAYHEIQPDMLEAALTSGLICTARGDKGDDAAIIKTDCYLDERRPEALVREGVSRDNNLYAYACVNGAVIDITNGEHVPVKHFVARSKQRVLELEIDPKRCFVSDLDTYDALKDALTHHGNKAVLERLAKSYWDKVTVLEKCNPATFRRPEVMVTYDVPPNHVKLTQRS
ncbi:hypothetical protein KI440_02950 [Candidatus Saccharibacteria bacterium TM7i]|nr:hypothetical protein KI440_02950 [Candidatus Saccharibacteria bacterium TM7i]